MVFLATRQLPKVIISRVYEKRKIKKQNVIYISQRVFVYYPYEKKIYILKIKQSYISQIAEKPWETLPI
jgi:hypothetical protein